MVRSEERQGREAGLGSKASMASDYLCGFSCQLVTSHLPPLVVFKDRGAQSEVHKTCSLNVSSPYPCIRARA